MVRAVFRERATLRLPLKRRRSVLVGVLSAVGLVGGVLLVPSAFATGVADAEAEAERLGREVAVAAEEYNDAVGRLQPLREQLEVAQARQADQQRYIDGLRAQIGLVAVEAFKGGGIDPSLRLLTADPLGYLEDASLVESVARSQSATMAQWQAALDQLRQDEATVAAKLTEIEALQDTLAARKADIERQLADAEDVLAEAQRIEAERAAATLAASRDRGAAVPAGGGTPVGTSCADIAIQAPTARAAAAIDFACAQIGKPYQWGASGPGSYDCSGLTSAAYAAAGVSLPRSSGQQYAAGTKVSRSEMQPGDLVYFYSPISHVGIYVGDGMIIDAPRTGKPVAIRSMAYMPYAGATRP